MYTVKNFRSKAELKRAVAAGQRVEVFQPNSDVTGFEAPREGRVCLEGPHYPEPHRWYAEATLREGAVVSVK